MSKAHNRQQNITLFISVFFLIGILLVAESYEDIRNYLNPGWFLISSSLFGICFGTMIWLKLNKAFRRAKFKTIRKYSLNAFFNIAFAATFIFLFDHLNKLFSSKPDCINSIVIDKYRHEEKARSFESNIITFKLNDQAETLYCDFETWQDYKVGDKIRVCVYKSPFYFNYLKLEN